MELYARSHRTTGIALTAAAITFAPLAIQAHPPTVSLPDVTPNVTVSDIRLTASPAQIEAAVAGLQAVLDDATVTVADVVGAPGQALIGVVDNIVRLIDVGFTGLIGATGNPTLAASLTIIQTLSHDAFAKLAENLSLANPVITSAVGKAGNLVTTALTGSLQNMLTAVATVIDDPLSPASYVGLFTAGLASAQLLAGNGLRAVQTLGDAGFDFAHIALGEVTFQFNNLVGGLSALLTQLGAASGVPVIEAAVRGVQGLVLAPARTVVNLGSGLAGAVLTTANAGFDLTLGGAAAIVDPVGSARHSAPNTSPIAVAPDDAPRSFTLSTEARIDRDVEDAAEAEGKGGIEKGGVAKGVIENDVERAVGDESGATRRTAGVERAADSGRVDGPAASGVSRAAS